MTSDGYKFPLRVTPLRSVAEGPDVDLLGTTTMMIIPFSYDYRLRVWNCQACQEAGLEWVGNDPTRHGEEHQRGLDYARVLFKKHPEWL